LHAEGRGRRPRGIIADLVIVLRREGYDGLSVVAACVAGTADSQGDIVEVPAIGGMDAVAGVVERFDADTVAVLACPEMSGVRLRELAWAPRPAGIHRRPAGTEIWL
jgi:hypothetical protein